MHTRTLTLLSALVLSSSVAFAQSDVPPAAPEAPVDQAPPAPPPEPPPPAPMAPPPAPVVAPAQASTVIAPTTPGLKIETPNGSSIKFGLLLQPQFQMAGSNAADGYGYNLYVRRTRLLVGGTLWGVFDYFFETDYANLGLANAETGVKSTPGMNVQDAFATAHPFGDVIKVDVGYMLPPLAHNAIQGAGTLYSYDYFSNSFNTSATPQFFGFSASSVGRDTGVQLRGLLLDKHLEYRAGLFQGIRNPDVTDPATMDVVDVGARNFFRFAARLQVNLLDPETGFFYAGTYLGAKHVLSLGGSIDIQSGYRYYAGDIFVDLPAGPGVFTAQVNVAHWNGVYVTTPIKETAVMAEIGYNIAGVKVSPILRVEKLWNNGSDPGRYGGGLAWWPYGYNSNLKLFYTQVRETGEAHALNQVNLQWQVYFY
ncbi:MAG TPA: porin [Polyangia bacterium]|nr:porin [Polyangia bacterium]